MPRSIMTRLAHIESRMAADQRHGTLLYVELPDDPAAHDEAVEAAIDDAERQGLPGPYHYVAFPRRAQSVEEWVARFGRPTS